MESFRAGSARPAGVSRRNVIKGAAWSVPVIAVAAATPMAAASGQRTLTWGQIPPIAACETTTATTVTLVDASGPISGETVTITLPAGLKWSDTASASKTFTTDASGVVQVDGIVSTGRAGGYTLTAQANSVAPATAPLTVEAATSAIWYSGNALTASPADSTADVQNPVSLAVAGNYVWAINAAGELYAHAGAVDGAWNKVTASGATTKVTASQGTDYGMAIIGGVVYRLNGGSTAPDAMPGLPGTPEDIAASGNYAYALMPDGTWWWRPVLGSTAWVKLAGGAGTYTSIDVNEGGGFGWAIGTDGEVYWTAPGSGFGATAQPSDPTDVLANTVRTAIGAGYAYAQDANGDVYSHFAASSSTPWVKMTGLPAGGATQIYTNTGGNWVWALANGTLYYSGNATSFSPADSAGTLNAAGGIDEVAIGGSYAYAKTSDGQWWGKPGASDGGWRKITGVPGNEVTSLSTNWGDFSWVIAPAVMSCP